MDFDANYNSVGLLLTMDGGNDSTSIPDLSPLGQTVTVIGDAKLKTAQSKFGGASCYFDGNGDYLSVPDHAGLEFGAGAFTIEAWIQLAGYSASYSGYYAAAIAGKDSVSDRNWSVNINGTASSWTGLTLMLSDGTPGTVSVSFTFSLNTWYHVAVTRDGSGNVRFFVNGTQAGSTQALAKTVRDGSIANRVGAIAYAGYEYYFKGYIDDLRITKGVARYTANFTPPGALIDGVPVISGTVKVAGSGSAEKVRVYRRDTGAFLAEQTAAANGTYGPLYTRYLGDIRVDFVPPSGYRPLSHTLSPPS